jgi:hypothetical protein
MMRIMAKLLRRWLRRNNDTVGADDEEAKKARVRSSSPCEMGPMVRFGTHIRIVSEVRMVQE